MLSKWSNSFYRADVKVSLTCYVMVLRLFSALPHSMLENISLH